MAVAAKRPKKTHALEKFEKLIARIEKLIARLTPTILLAVAFLEAIQKFAKSAWPESSHDLKTIVLCTALAGLLGFAVILVARKILGALGCWKPRFKSFFEEGLRKLRSRRAAYLLLFVAGTATVVLAAYRLASRTDAWYFVSAHVRRPLVDLASNSREKTFQPAFNLPWFNYGQDFGQVRPWEWRGVSRDSSILENSLEKLRQIGIRHVVWFLFCDGRSLRFDAKGNVSGLDKSFLQDYDAAIDMAWKKQMGITWVLIDYTFMLPHEETNRASLFGHADILEDQGKRESFYKNALTPLLRRFRYSPEIVGWILINEPENAVKDGHVSAGAVQAFIRETAILIKKEVHRQPASVANADLESLIEYSGACSDVLDFFIFHHYAGFLPPPMSHVRSIMKGASNKPIYIGEFSMKNPPVPAQTFVTWSKYLGAAGAWPWNSNASSGGSNAPVIPSYEEAKVSADFIQEKNHEVTRLYEKFESRHKANTGASDTRFNLDDLDWWTHHWNEQVIPAVRRNVSEWSTEISKEEGEFRKNKEWERTTLGWIADTSAYKAAKQAESKNAELSLARNTRNKYAPGIDESQQWCNEVKAEIVKADLELQDQQKNLETARRRMASESSLADYYRYHVAWSQKLYYEFWAKETENTK